MWAQDDRWLYHIQGRFCLQITVREALNSALDEELERDDSVFVLGEEARYHTISVSSSWVLNLHEDMGCQAPAMALALLEWRFLSCRLENIKGHTRCTFLTWCLSDSDIVLVSVKQATQSWQKQSSYRLYALQITKGLVQKYGPERIRDTPITEARYSTCQLRIARPVV